KLLGSSRLHRRSVKAVLQEDLKSPDGRRQFARADLQLTSNGSYIATPLGAQHSHLMGDLARANSLVVVPENTTHVSAGQIVDTVTLDHRAEKPSIWDASTTNVRKNPDA